MIAFAVVTIVILIITSIQESITFTSKPAHEGEFSAVDLPQPRQQRSGVFNEQEWSTRKVTAYNVGDPDQTDGTPCRTADGSNACLELALGEKICAANFVPIGTKLVIEGIGVCTVKDRLNSRFKNRIDIAMEAHEKGLAKKFGLKNLQVHILK